MLAILSHILRMSGAGAGEPEAPVPAPVWVQGGSEGPGHTGAGDSAPLPKSE